MGSTDTLATASDGTANWADVDAYATPRRRKRRHVYAVPLAAAQAPQPISVDVSHLLWQLRAACRGTDPEAFFDTSADVDQLRAICAGCPVIAECREYADKHRLSGFWAGTTEAERQRDRIRARRQARQASR